MMQRVLIVCVSFVFIAIGLVAQSHAEGKRKFKDQIKVMGQTGQCIDCHQDHTPALFEEWINSAHAKANVGCQDCHSSQKGEPDTFLHAEKFYIRTVVTPFVCGKCHKDEQRDYFTSGHAKSLELLLQMKENDPRYPIVSQYKDDDFRQCGGCHGVKVEHGKGNFPDPVTWPNSGAGRINPNKSHGNCASCHMTHRFSVAAARQPETCLRCHDGANYPEGDIYRNSAHGVLYETQVDKKVLERTGYYLDGEAMVSPTCSFCHLNGSGHGLLTRHNGAWRLPRDLTHPEAPMALERKENLRNNMKSVCNQCHASSVINRFFQEADKQLEEYQATVMVPGIARYKDMLDSVQEEGRQALLKEYNVFLTEGKRYRMNLYMGRHGRVQR
ncbi:MAG: hypothetical protein H8E41_14165 [Desulfobulbaceae bacterium]|uniref:Cytochrome c-552/4 domain-containing protein n=1 Tax=Candidatus Desulfobia pelagia TaxID=2841692 RepID=A0A8J6TDB1_9BACT|nr:hypothetical protein [Candidatus Desulfobia pelagia]